MECYHDFYYFKMNAHTSICRSCYLSRWKSSCTWKMPKKCVAHHIQAQFGQMSGAFAVSSLLTASVPWQSALQPCIMGEANWFKFVQAQFGRVLRFSCQPQCHCGCIFGWRSTERTPENLDLDIVCVTTPLLVAILGYSLHVQVW